MGLAVGKRVGSGCSDGDIDGPTDARIVPMMDELHARVGRCKSGCSTIVCRSGIRFEMFAGFKLGWSSEIFDEGNVAKVRSFNRKDRNSEPCTSKRSVPSLSST